MITTLFSCIISKGIRTVKIYRFIFHWNHKYVLKSIDCIYKVLCLFLCGLSHRAFFFFFVVLLLFWKTCNADHFLNHSDFALWASPFTVKGKDINNLRPNPGEKCVHKEQGYIARKGCEHLTT